MRKLKKIFILLIILIITLNVTGCPKPDPKENLALIIGSRANSALLGLEKIESYIQKSFETYGYVSVIQLDGAPYQVGYIDASELLDESKVIQEQVIESYKNQTNETMKAMAAKTEEADVMAAIEVGRRALKSRETGNNTMLILDSGISTTGSVNFTKSFLESIDLDRMIEELKENNALPNLEGIHVIWGGLGDTVEPQTALSPKNRKVLKEVWERILKEAKAETVEFIEDLPSTEETSKEFPPVSVVERLTPISEGVNYDLRRLTLILDTINFQIGSEELITDMETVQNALKPIVDYGVEHSEYKILLAGTTDSGSGETKEALIGLSERRCNVIKQIMVSLGMNENQIEIKGLGINHPFYSNDINEDGSLNEEIAKSNRTVMLLSKESEIAKMLVNKN